MKTAVVVISVLCSVAGCNKSLDPENVSSYPFNPSAEWNYRGIDSTYNFRPVSPGATFRDSVVHWNSNVKYIGERLLHDTVRTSLLRATETFDSSTQEVTNKYYATTGDSLFLYAYDGTASSLPKKSIIKYMFNGQTFNSIRELTRRYEGSVLGTVGDIVYEVNPPKVLVFPLKIGLEWTYRAPSGNPWYIGKKIVGHETITTPGGSFATYKVQWIWDFNGDAVPDSDATGYDHITSAGLLKRTFVFTNAAVTVGDPTPIGYIDIIHEYVVTSFSVPISAFASY